MQNTSFKIGNHVAGGGGKFTLIAGPCVIESKEHAYHMARSIKKITDELGIGFVFKASFDKANRTSIHSFRGPGIEEGINILLDIKNELKIPITTDLHTVAQLEQYGKDIDIVQLPAFLCRQTDLIIAAGETGSIVNVKKGQFLAPEQMRSVIEKVKSTGNHKVIITERGYAFGYGDLIVDMRNFHLWKSFDALTCFDATHSVQRPGANKNTSGGDREYIPALARSAIAAGVDVLFMEVHDDPAKAMSDAATQFKLSDLSDLLTQLLEIDSIVKNLK